MLGSRKPYLRRQLFTLTNLTMLKTVEGGLRDFTTNIPLQNIKKQRMSFLSQKKTKNETFQQSQSAEKSKRDPLQLFNNHSISKYQKKMKEGGSRKAGEVS